MIKNQMTDKDINISSSGIIFEVICDKAVKFMILVIAAVFAIWAARYTYYYPEDYSSELLLPMHDSIWKNVLAAGAAILLLYGLQAVVLRGTEEQKKKRIWFMAIADIVIVGILLTIWVANSHIAPYWDQLQVFNDAIRFRQGDYGDMSEYLFMYPQQYGLIFLYEIVLPIWENYGLIQYLNILFIMTIIFMSYRITEELFHNQTVNFYCILGTTVFLPMHIYVSYVYGDIPSIALSLVAIWAVLKWCQQRKWQFWIVTLVSFTIATLARKNTLIIMIAVCLALFIYAWKERVWKALVLATLILALPLTSVELVKEYYELRSGNEIGDGIPSVLWIAMGMQYHYGAVGVYSGYNESIFRGPGESDTQKAAEIGQAYIKERLSEFKEKPGMAIDFYKTKIQEQWNEPTYSAMAMTSKFKEEQQGLVKAIYFGTIPKIMFKFMNYYMFLIYFGVFVYALNMLFHKRSIMEDLMLIAIIGGVLFCVIWEAKGRYMLPYVISMLPYMSGGIYLLQERVKNLAHRLHKNSESHEQSEQSKDRAAA